MMMGTILFTKTMTDVITMMDPLMEVKKEPEKKMWCGLTLVRVSDVPGFAEWLQGQTCPLVDDDPRPTDWAYISDYRRYKYELRVID